jgi:hypothetical protein
MIVDKMDIGGVGRSFDSEYGCSFGCGNEFTMVVTTVHDTTTQMLCIPCFVKMAMEIIAAMTEPDNPIVQAAMEAQGSDIEYPSNARGRKQSLIGGVETSDGSEFLDAFEPDVSESI